jgi:hypothetical protein
MTPRAGPCSDGEVLAAGNVASGENDSGDPVKVGFVHNTTLPTLADGSRVDAQADSRGRLRTTDVAAVTATHTADNTISNASESVLAANTSRVGFIIQNVGTTNVRVNLAGSTATTTNGLQLTPGQVLQMFGKVPTGAITAIREGAADGTLHVVEFT